MKDTLSYQLDNHRNNNIYINIYINLKPIYFVKLKLNKVKSKVPSDNAVNVNIWHCEDDFVNFKESLQIQLPDNTKTIGDGVCHLIIWDVPVILKDGDQVHHVIVINETFYFSKYEVN